MHTTLLAILVSSLAVVPQRTDGSGPSSPLYDVAWGDFDGDGLEDLYVLVPGAPDRLLANTGDGTFVDVTEATGLPPRGAGSRAASWRDVDDDGRLDLLLVTDTGALRLWRGIRNGLLEEAPDAGLAAVTGASAAEWFDYDRDGCADLRISTEIGPQLFHNRGAGRFASVTLGLPESSNQPVAVPTRTAAAEPTEENARPNRAEVSDRERAKRVGRSSGSANGDTPTRTRDAAPGGTPSKAAATGSVGPFGFALPICADLLIDAATNACIGASSVPTLGKLYPLGMPFWIEASNGRVGMGSFTAPTHQLMIQGATDNVLRLLGTGTFGSAAKLNLGDGDFVHLWEYADDRLQVKGDKEVLLTALGGGGEVNVVTQKFNVGAPGGTRFTTGNVGIGTTSAPAWPLDMLAPQAVARLQSSTSTNGSVLELRNLNTAPTSIGAINFVNAAGQFNGQIAYLGANTMTFRTGGSERARIDASGNVAIGTSFTTRKLHVDGGANPGTIYGVTSNVNGDAIFGHVNSSATGAGYGVRGESGAVGGHAVHGDATASSGFSHGVYGSSNSPAGAGVFGANFTNPTSGPPDVAGVYGEVSARRGQGVWGRNWDTTSGGAPVPAGVVGTCGTNGYAIIAEGDFIVTGAKAFAQPHPHDASKMLRFMCLEGNESGTYCRGSDALAGGVRRIALPEDFRLASAGERITAQVTPRGPAFVWVESVTREALVVRGAQDVPFDWVVNGVRAGYEEHETIVDNSAFRPRVQDEPFLQDRSASFRKLLHTAGITNADGTPNAATAAALGWDLLDRDDPRAAMHLPPERRPRADKPQRMEGTGIETLER